MPKQLDGFSCDCERNGVLVEIGRTTKDPGGNWVLFYRCSNDECDEVYYVNLKNDEKPTLKKIKRYDGEVSRDDIESALLHMTGAFLNSDFDDAMQLLSDATGDYEVQSEAKALEFEGRLYGAILLDASMIGKTVLIKAV